MCIKYILYLILRFKQKVWCLNNKAKLQILIFKYQYIEIPKLILIMFSIPKY